jgi:RNA-directed DNA polymerase
MMSEGVCARRFEGTPQGGPLSPLLANLLLDDLDRMLEARGHRFCRYADDVNIYVRSETAGQRVMAALAEFLQGRLHLQVNREKSAVAPVGARKFLGHRLLLDGSLAIAPQSLTRMKQRVREITKRSPGISLARRITELNSFLAGWVTYFRHARCKSHLRRLDEWIRRKLRCVRLKHCKRAKAQAGLLRSLGVPERRAWVLALSGKGWWRKARSCQANEAMTLAWFLDQGFLPLTDRHLAVQTEGNCRGT